MEQQKEPEAGPDVPVAAIPEKVTNLITRLEHLSYGARLGELEMSCLEKRRLQGVLRALFSA